MSNLRRDEKAAAALHEAVARSGVPGRSFSPFRRSPPAGGGIPERKLSLRPHPYVSEASPIAVFDSGVGGLSVFREIRRLLPAESLIYFADQAHVPYGDRSLEEVGRYCEGIARFLIERGVKLVVVACNTGSAAALRRLREVFPEVPFVGMEPAVKPAALASRTGVIGVLATSGTFQGELFETTVRRFAQGVRVLTRTCPGLVEAIEDGDTSSPRVRELVFEAVGPLLDQGIDSLVLGCTHYPFALSALREACGPGVEVLDPSPAVARHVARTLEDRSLLAEVTDSGPLTFYTTGCPQRLERVLPVLLGESGGLSRASWQGGGASLCECRPPGGTRARGRSAESRSSKSVMTLDSLRGPLPRTRC